MKAFNEKHFENMRKCVNIHLKYGHYTILAEIRLDSQFQVNFDIINDIEVNLLKRQSSGVIM